MTTDTQIKTKKIPDLSLYVKGVDGKNHRVGVAFKHKSGDGFDILVAGTRYAAFPPKTKSDAPVVTQ